jgi:integrase
MPDRLSAAGTRDSIGLTTQSPDFTHKLKLLEQVRNTLRVNHYSLRTEEAYLQWIRRFISSMANATRPKWVQPRWTPSSAISPWRAKFSASTQNQALNAIVFLYKHVLKIDLGDFSQFTRAKRPRKLPVVLTSQEVARLLDALEPPFLLMATLLYGSGLRLMDCLRLRIKDLDFGYQQIVVRDGKGNKDRVTVLPVSAIEPLRLHLQTVRTLHRQDRDKIRRGDVHAALSREAAP